MPGRGGLAFVVAVLRDGEGEELTFLALLEFRELTDLSGDSAVNHDVLLFGFLSVDLSFRKGKNRAAQAWQIQNGRCPWEEPGLCLPGLGKALNTESKKRGERDEPNQEPSDLTGITGKVHQRSEIGENGFLLRQDPFRLPPMHPDLCKTDGGSDERRRHQAIAVFSTKNTQKRIADQGLSDNGVSFLA